MVEIIVLAPVRAALHLAAQVWGICLFCHEKLGVRRDCDCSGAYSVTGSSGSQ